MFLIGPKGQLVTTKNVKELHGFAKRLGLKREWFKKLNEDGSRGYYSLKSKPFILQALSHGAEIIELDDPDSRKYLADLMGYNEKELGVISFYLKKLAKLWPLKK